MPRRVTPAQLRSKIRQAEAKQRQAVNRYNAAVRQHNAKVRRNVNEYNAAVRRDQREIDSYNRKVRAHNAKVRANRRRLESEIARLNRQGSTVRFVATQHSTRTLHTAFRRFEAASETEAWGDDGAVLVDLAEGETANSAAVTNALLGEASSEVEDTTITDELSVLSEDLDRRWRGALFSINPQNPDAARHFCTSAREIITGVIDLNAPDDVVLATVPACRTTQAGKPVRRDKIGYLLSRTATNHESLGDFIEVDVDDVMNLFRVFNDGTHGHAGALDLTALRALKSRVEGAIRFLSAVVRGV